MATALAGYVGFLAMVTALGYRLRTIRDRAPLVRPVPRCGPVTSKQVHDTMLELWQHGIALNVFERAESLNVTSSYFGVVRAVAGRRWWEISIEKADGFHPWRRDLTYNDSEGVEDALRSMLHYARSYGDLTDWPEPRPRPGVQLVRAVGAARPWKGYA